VVAEYRDLVKKGREQFQKELESVLPDVKLGEKSELSSAAAVCPLSLLPENVCLCLTMIHASRNVCFVWVLRP
jgi:hypothetical protein